MRTSQEIDKIAPALAKAQAKLTNPKRNRKVVVKQKNGGQFEYSYATLDTILDLIRPVLAENELSIQQGTIRTADVLFTLTTRITHSSGQWYENDTPLPYTGIADAQALGSAMSYSKRYGVTAILALASEDDDDGRLTKEKEKNIESEIPADDPIRKKIEEIASFPALQAYWKTLTVEQRTTYTAIKDAAKAAIAKADEEASK